MAAPLHVACIVSVAVVLVLVAAIVAATTKSGFREDGVYRADAPAGLSGTALKWTTDANLQEPGRNAAEAQVIAAEVTPASAVAQEPASAVAQEPASAVAQEPSVAQRIQLYRSTSTGYRLLTRAPLRRLTQRRQEHAVPRKQGAVQEPGVLQKPIRYPVLRSVAVPFPPHARRGRNPALPPLRRSNAIELPSRRKSADRL